MPWQDKALLLIFVIIPSIIAIIYYAYCLYVFFLKVEYIQEEEVTAAEFKQTYSKPVTLKVIKPELQDPLKTQFDRLIKKGAIPADTDFIEWAKTQPGTGELLNAPIELTANSQKV